MNERNRKMRRCPIAAFFAAAGALLAPARASAEGGTFPLWPEGKIPMYQDVGPETVKPTTDDIVRFTNVSVPTVTFVKPAADAPVPAVLVCPGGGYSYVAWGHEGSETAQWFAKRGVAAFILKYRCPDRRDAAFADAQRAISCIRANAVNFGVDPTNIGIVGYSAGANLAARVSTCHAKRGYEPVDSTDKASCRPDWALVIYPWDLVDGQVGPGKGTPGLRGCFAVDRSTPQTFIVQSQDDPCGVQNSLAYYAALTAAGVKAEMHLFSAGGHGYGMREKGNPTDCWPVLAEAWLPGIVLSGDED